MMRTLFILLCSVAGGILSAMVFAGTVDPAVGWKALTLPAVLPIAVVFGGVTGIVLSPLMIWALKMTNLWIALPCILALAWLTIIILNRLGLVISEWITIGITVFGLLVFGSYRHVSRKKQLDIRSNQPPPSPFGQP